MAKSIKLFISFFIILLSFLSLYSKASTCPSVETIQRISGEYRWTSTVPGWEGYFISPMTGKGRSYKITAFNNASWVKSNDTPDSTGFIQCDYRGDFTMTVKVPNPNYKPEDEKSPKEIEVPTNEVIRFTQSKANGSYMPASTAKNAWTCVNPAQLPDEACICMKKINECRFQAG